MIKQRVSLKLINNEKKNTDHTFEIVAGIFLVLTIVFIVLKLCGVIGWSWVWVFSPLWLSVLAFFLYLIVIFIVGSLKR